MNPSLLAPLMYASAFLAVLSLALALGGLLRRAKPSGDGPQRPPNALTASRWGGLIRAVASINNTASLQSHLNQLDSDLMLAGRPGDGVQADEFLAAAELIALATALLIITLSLLTGTLGAGTLLASLSLGAMVILFAHLWLSGLVTERRSAITHQFPGFLDLAVMTMEAGSSLLETLDFYVRDNPDLALARELSMVQGEIRLGKTLQEALEALKERITAEEVINTIDALLQGQRMGTPLGEVFRDQADTLRFRRYQMIERAAEELKVKLQGPAMLMVISILILILAPAFLEVSQGGMF